MCKTCSTKHKNEVSLGNQIEVEIRGTFIFRSCTSLGQIKPLQIAENVYEIRPYNLNGIQFK